MDRDERDQGRLAACAQEVTELLDRLAPLMGPLEHPRARWSPDDLVEALREQAGNIAETQQIYRGALFIDEDC